MTTFQSKQEKSIEKEVYAKIKSYQAFDLVSNANVMV